MSTGGCVRIQYVGAQASCLIQGNAGAKTLTAKVGASGAEFLDASFGSGGTIDLTAAPNNTLAGLAATVDAYANYTATILYGDDIPTQNVLDSVAQAKAQPASVLFSISTVLDSDALTSWERAKLFLSLADSDQTMTEYLLNAITTQAELLAGRPLKARTVTQNLDGNDRPDLMLPLFPITAVSQLNIDPTRAFLPATDLTAADYAIYGPQGFISLLWRYFPCGTQNVKVAWTGGYSPVPDDLQLAAIECVSWNFKRIRGAGIGVRSVTAAEVNTSLEITIPLSAQRVFESYKAGA